MQPHVCRVCGCMPRVWYGLGRLAHQVLRPPSRRVERPRRRRQAAARGRRDRRQREGRLGVRLCCVFLFSYPKGATCHNGGYGCFFYYVFFTWHRSALVRMLYLARRMLHVTSRMPCHVACCMSHLASRVPCCMLHVACRISHVARRMSHVACCTSHAACRMSHVACRRLPAARCMLHVAFHRSAAVRGHPKWRFHEAGRSRPCVWVQNDRQKIRSHGEPAHVPTCHAHVTFCIIKSACHEGASFCVPIDAQPKPGRFGGSGRVPK